ncbi:hypothetical protein LTR12_002072 [Friedmanniomyces endolithicus]|nr:hypothetical protein LTR12_002072 [Friedmanniomyces endolithicus]
MLTYEPLVEGLERNLPRDKLELLLVHFHAEAATLFAIDRIVTSRVGDLFVLEMSVPFEVRENEGQERVVDVSRRREVVVSPVTVAAVAAETGKSGAGINGVGGSASPPPPTPPPTSLQPAHQPPPQLPQAPQPAQPPQPTAPIQPEQPVTRGVTAAVAAARGLPPPTPPPTSVKPSQ